jgi:hypothetical protein
MKKKQKKPKTRTKASRKANKTRRVLPSEAVVIGPEWTEPGLIITVDTLPEPPVSRRERTIHARRPAPKVPEGEAIPDENPTPPIDLSDGS